MMMKEKIKNDFYEIFILFFKKKILFNNNNNNRKIFNIIIIKIIYIYIKFIILQNFQSFYYFY